MTLSVGKRELDYMHGHMAGVGSLGLGDLGLPTNSADIRKTDLIVANVKNNLNFGAHLGVHDVHVLQISVP